MRFGTDFAIRQRPERVASLLKALHGRKHLITGNNDDAAVKGCHGWENIQPYAELSVMACNSSCATIPHCHVAIGLAVNDLQP